MSHPRTVSSATENNNAMTFYCPPSLKNKFDAFCKAKGVTKSECLRKHMESDIEGVGGSLKADFDYRGAQLRIDILSKELGKLGKTLSFGSDKGGQTLFEVLCKFCVDKLGAETVEKCSGQSREVELVFNSALKVKLYEHLYVGSEPFSDSNLEAFIRYVERQIEFKALVADCRSHRKSKCKAL